ncbi:Rho termination factor N-terminal domain-containing protein [Bifidobacterium sp.]|uniref:Rho termination factor N-terminal domain-containing protein n=1 Tax=Bifidobacterium sp. TaxID=41200 RepID=UPI0038678749
MPRVTQAFRDGATWRAYAIGDTYEGPRADELAALGLLAAEGSDEGPLEPMTLAQLRALASEVGADVPAKARKADVIAAIEAAREG